MWLVWQFEYWTHCSSFWVITQTKIHTQALNQTTFGYSKDLTIKMGTLKTRHTFTILNPNKSRLWIKTVSKSPIIQPIMCTSGVHGVKVAQLNFLIDYSLDLYTTKIWKPHLCILGIPSVFRYLGSKSGHFT